MQICKLCKHICNVLRTHFPTELGPFSGQKSLIHIFILLSTCTRYVWVIVKFLRDLHVRVNVRAPSAMRIGNHDKFALISIYVISVMLVLLWDADTLTCTFVVLQWCLCDVIANYFKFSLHEHVPRLALCIIHWCKPIRWHSNLSDRKLALLHARYARMQSCCIRWDADAGKVYRWNTIIMEYSGTCKIPHFVYFHVPTHLPSFKPFRSEDSILVNGPAWMYHQGWSASTVGLPQ